MSQPTKRTRERRRAQRAGSAGGDASADPPGEAFRPPAPGRAARRVALLAALAAVASLARVGFPGNLDHPGPDDAYITYRYAENLAAGNGWVFNPGTKPVLGTSTPLYALMLALGAKLGLDVPRLSLGLGTLATASTAALLVWIGARVGAPAGGFAAALVWVASPFSHALLEGMETPLTILVALAALGSSVQGRVAQSVLLAAIATLLRLEGLAVLAVVAAQHALAGRWSWRAAAPGLVLLAAWAVYATIVVGGPIPASGLAKAAHDDAISERYSLRSWHLVYFVAPILSSVGVDLTWMAPVLIGVAVVAGLLLGRTARVAALLAAWLVLNLAGHLAVGLPDFSWYYGPPAIAAVFLLWIGFDRLLGRARGRAAPGVILGAAVLLAIPLWLAPIPESPWGTARPAQLEAGRWLRAHAERGATVVAYEVGMIGYASGLHVVDLLGLTEPEARPHLERRDYAWAIRERRPTYVFTNRPSDWPVTRAIFESPEFRAHYKPVARFAFRPDTDYLLFQRAAGRR